ncbi:MAG: adenylyltransferase/cytidyltransferase family protein [Spirochaetia bacterium]|jgi:cytidyltransferase-like protein|nr:adenylyltransferase/cytidyltransferase family protein [Spirochaetia bacterium]
MKYDRCVVNGVFDLFHVGHVRLLQRAKEMFKEVVVTIDSDELTMKEKRKPIFSQEERLEIVKACRYADDAVIIDRSWGPHAVDPAMVDDFMNKYNIDAAFVAADDEEYVKYWFGHLYNQGRVVVVPRTRYVSTTHVIKIVNGEIVKEEKSNALNGEKQGK